jgi:predicted metal-dependent phosphoesterase TrpH
VTASGRCDLHLHSTASDGTVPPREVVRLAKEARLDAMALTDHDTFDGVEEALDEGARRGIRVVPGVELSLPHAGTFHMIALGVDPANAAIRGVADLLREGRGPRNAEIVRVLNGLGFDLTLEDVEREAPGGVVARPHIARVMVKRGWARSFQDAFDQWLGKGRPAYVDRARVSVAAAVAATRAAGGATIVCHPYTLLLGDDAAFVAFLRDCGEAGVDAVEVRTGRATAADERRWEAIAAAAGMLPSGGSDFHGDNKPDLRIGSGKGRLHVPMEWLEALLDRARSRATTSG